jgi:ATP synthase protein I
MGYATSFLQASVRKLLIVQLALTLFAALAGLVLSGSPAAWSALYGGTIVLLNTAILASRIGRAGELVASRPGASMAMLYSGVALRFLLTLLLFALGIGALKLEPIPMLVAFGAAQLAFLFNSPVPQRPEQP